MLKEHPFKKHPCKKAKIAHADALSLWKIHGIEEKHASNIKGLSNLPVQVKAAVAEFL